MSFFEMQMRSKSRIGRDGFTIIELLVATAVTAILAGLMISMISSVLSAWNRTSGALQTNNDAKLIFDILGEDLQGAIYKNDGSVWLAVDVLHPGGVGGYTEANLANNHGWRTTGANGSVSIKPADNLSSLDMIEPNLEEARYGLGGSWLRFFSNSSGAVSAISYQVVRRHILDAPAGVANNPAEIRYMFVRSTNSPLSLNTATTATQRAYDLAPGSLIYSEPNTNLINPPTSSVIATNVIDFGVRLYVRNIGTGTLDLLFPADGATPPNLSNNHRQYLAGGAGTAILQYPEVADVFVRILTPEGAQLIENLEAGRITGNWWEVALANSRVYTQRYRIVTQSE